MTRFPTEYLAYLFHPKVLILSTLFFWIVQTGYVLFLVLFGLSSTVVYVGHPISCEFLPDTNSKESKHDHDYCYTSGIQTLDDDFEEHIPCGYYESNSMQDISSYQVRYFSCLTLFAIERRPKLHVYFTFWLYQQFYQDLQCTMIQNCSKGEDKGK